jgi:hypothetical protein
MHGELKNENVEAARTDLVDRTLAKIRGDLARLVYLASMRDYNTGEYHHEGLSYVFTESVAGRAIASCHREVFRRLVLCSVKELVEQLELYARTNCSSSSELARVWTKLQPYRVTLPLECSPLAGRFFFTNIKAALAVLESRQLRAHREPQSALPGP